MAKREPYPLLSVAAFCDRVLEGSDSAMSAVRFVDQIAVPAPGDDPAARTLVRLEALVAFKTGGQCRRTLRLVLRMPSGKTQVVQERDMVFSDEQTIFNLRLKVELKVKTEGLYWVDVFVDKKLYTKMPLLVRFIHQPEQEQVLAQRRSLRAQNL